MKSGSETGITKPVNGAVDGARTARDCHPHHRAHCLQRALSNASAVDRRIAERSACRGTVGPPTCGARFRGTIVSSFIGSDGERVSALRAIELRCSKSGRRTDLEVQGAFVAIGHDPATTLFKGQVATDADGYILTTPGSTRTSVSGVFAAGDVQDKTFRQAVTAAGSGCMAALEAEKWLAAEEASRTGLTAAVVELVGQLPKP